MTKTTPSGSQQLQRLLLRMADKDEAAFATLYAATRRKLFTVVLPIAKRQHVAEDVVQDTYLRIWQNAASYRPSLGSPMLWMIVIARNRAIDIARKPLREIGSDDSVLHNFPTSCPTPLEAIEIFEDEAQELIDRFKVLDALRSLDPTRRHLIVAAYLRGESRKHLSRRFGVPVNTIKTWIRRALLEARAGVLSAASPRPPDAALRC